MICQGLRGRISHHFLMLFRSRFQDPFLTVLGSILGFILGPKCVPKGTQNESKNQHENQVEKESQKVAKRTPNINPPGPGRAQPRTPCHASRGFSYSLVNINDSLPRRVNVQRWSRASKRFPSSASPPVGPNRP